MKCFSNLEGDHITLINVYRAAEEFMEKKRLGLSKEKAEKMLRKWCKENFINSRSLRHARDIHGQIRGHVEQMGLHLSSCGDDMLQFRRCLSASFFLNAAVKQPEGTYRYLISPKFKSFWVSSNSLDSKGTFSLCCFWKICPLFNRKFANVHFDTYIM